jgi:uncharacterized protein YegL
VHEYKKMEKIAMMDFFDELGAEHRITPVLFVVEASSSMMGERMDAINTALHTVVEALAEMNRSGERRTRYAVLRFSTDAEWRTDGWVDPCEVSAPRIFADGMTSWGSALEQIDRKLFRDFTISREIAFGVPKICFIATGFPIDDYRTALNHINENRWYRHAWKKMVVIGECVDSAIMGEVVGSEANVVQVECPSHLGRILLRLLLDQPCDSNELSESLWTEDAEDDPFVDWNCDTETSDHKSASAFSEPAPVICVSCRKQISSDFQFCPYCGRHK